MEKSIFDIAVDILIERRGLAKVELRKRFKGVKPFRMEKVSDEDRIANYMQWANDPEMEMEMRQSLGDEGVDTIHNNMHNLINRGR